MEICHYTIAASDHFETGPELCSCQSLMRVCADHGVRCTYYPVRDLRHYTKIIHFCCCDSAMSNCCMQSFGGFASRVIQNSCSTSALIFCSGASMHGLSRSTRPTQADISQNDSRIMSYRELSLVDPIANVQLVDPLRLRSCLSLNINDESIARYSPT